MTWQYAYNPDLWPATFSALLAVVLGVYSWRRRSVTGAKAFAIGCLFGTLWAFGTFMQIAATDVPTKIFWLKFHAAWQLPTVTALACFFLQYAGLGRFITKRNVVFLSFPAAVTLLLFITNDLHHLMWTGFEVDGSVIGVLNTGSWVSILYGSLLGIVNMIALVSLAIRTPRARWPVALMLFGQISGRVMYVLDSSNRDLFSPGVSAFFVIGVSCSAYAFALFQFRALDPVPLARSVVIEQMTDGMLVLDLSGRIVEMNPAAASVLNLPAAAARGREITTVLPSDAGIEMRPGEIHLSKPEITIGSGDEASSFSLGLTRLVDRRGGALGHLLLMHDITDLRRSQELLIEQQRVVATLQERERLARELHDSVGQVLGYASMQAQTALRWVEEGNPEKAGAILTRLAEVAQDAHADVRESILSLRGGNAQDWTFVQALQQYLEHYQKSYGISASLHLPEQVGENLCNPVVGVQVMRVIQEALSNARKHGGAGKVHVACSQAGGLVNIAVEDDGCGFDPDDAGRQGEGHLGLVFMKERMTEIGGSLQIDSQPGEGTTVKLTVPCGT